jgi:hypothetical protein
MAHLAASHSESAMAYTLTVGFDDDHLIFCGMYEGAVRRQTTCVVVVAGRVNESVHAPILCQIAIRGELDRLPWGSAECRLPLVARK